MFEKKYSSTFWILFSLLLYLGIWSLASLDDLAHNRWPLKGIGTYFGIAGYFLFSLALLLSSRWKRLEDWIGGLDQIYHLHRRMGIWGFCLILIHPWIVAIKWLPNNIEKFILFTLPTHGRLSVNLGSIAFWLMILILGITFLKLLSYDKWKSLHKFMSLVFILTSLHIVLSENRFGSEIAQSLLLIPMTIGFFGIIHKQLFLPFFLKKPALRVVSINKINYNVVEVALTSIDAPIRFVPGQYGFFSFQGTHLTQESHPFTLIYGPGASTITILVKARGDFTRSLFQNIEVGYMAQFEGPYGRFSYAHVKDPQIWIAGGIGIAPFVAWERSMKQMGYGHQKIDLYYCIHRKEDALFYEEFELFSKSNSNFNYYLHCTDEDNRLNVQKIINTSGGISGKKILMCGPIKLTSDFKKQFQNLGVKEKDIHFEDFEFF